MERWEAARLGAGILLLIYLALAALFSGRELRFLAGVEPRERRMFLFQDVLIQLAIAGVLLPCALAPRMSKPLLIAVAAAFGLMWVASLWLLISRSMYTYRLMLGLRGKREEQARLLKQLADKTAGEAGDG